LTVQTAAGMVRAMCNYYDRHRDPRNHQAMFRFPELPNMEPRYVVRPTNVERVVVEQDSGRHLVSMRWGLVPFWSKDIKTGLTMFNAQSETILEKAVLQRAVASRTTLPCAGRRLLRILRTKGRQAAALFQAARRSGDGVRWLMRELARAEGCAAR
jgi:hypothetical protein